MTEKTCESALAVDSERLWNSLREVSAFGATPGGGLDRLALGDHDRAARDHLVAAARERGWAVAVDPVGNVFVTRQGTEPDLPPVLIGSHLDSQPLGGRYDGTYGVHAGLEVLRALDDAGVATRRSLVLADWTNEEGSRFSPSMLGSAVYSGAHDLDAALARTDTSGATLGGELARIGYAGAWGGVPRRLHRALEVHIEQGPVLEAEGVDIGVVTGVYGIRWYDVSVRGEGGHSGTTPMALRRDALVAAGAVVRAVSELADRLSPELRATTGEIVVSPNSRNSIPGSVRLALDVRHPEDAVLDRAERALEELTADVARATGTEVTIEPVLSQPPTVFDPRAVAGVRAVAERLGLSNRDLVSGAGHDSVHLARVTPTAMIFIPCVGGISHHESEDIRHQWAVDGANALLHAALDAAQESED
ncbi:Zn-dependent hydrolase [Streptomyces sp. NPDC090106]|uniref:Zn-dependent hydrolase n=1 Tax=Streptomyces sp. NPDC090106 TaxID=3365946 RepID=UPI0038113F50